MLRKLSIIAFLILASVLAWANLPENRLGSELRADRIVVEKGQRRLILFRQGVALKAYKVSLGGNPSGHKQQEGDRRTPEGAYRIDRRNPGSSFHRALHVSYPDQRDIASAAGRNVAPGGDIMIHGVRNGLGWLGKLQRCFDWTAGCIAVTNSEIEEIWDAVPDGTLIEILP